MPLGVGLVVVLVVCLSLVWVILMMGVVLCHLHWGDNVGGRLVVVVVVGMGVVGEMPRGVGGDATQGVRRSWG